MGSMSRYDRLFQTRRAFIGLLYAVGIGALFPSPLAAAAPSCRMKSPDLTVHGIRLGDVQSAVRAVGSAPALKQDTDDLPHARFVSFDGRQELILFVHYGAGIDEYAEVEVREAGIEALAIPELESETFVTEHGIGLGLSSAEVLAIFGKCFKSRDREGDAELIQYQIEGAPTDPVLKSFGYSSYFAEYEFRKDKLVRFRFGFEYP
jgi:hypothetical protein